MANRKKIHIYPWYFRIDWLLVVTKDLSTDLLLRPLEGFPGRGREGATVLHSFPKLKRLERNLYTYTPPKCNIAPEKWWLEDYVPIGRVTFQGLC